MAQSKFTADHETPTRAVPEGGGAAETPGGLLALAEAIGTAKGDLSGTLEREAQALSEQDRRQLLDEMLALEQENPGTFLAGALAGFALGRAAAEAGPRQAAGLASSGGGHPGSGQQQAGEAGIVSPPIETAQTAPGGLGYLESASPEDDMPGKEQR